MLLFATFENTCGFEIGSSTWEIGTNGPGLYTADDEIGNECLFESDTKEDQPKKVADSLNLKRLTSGI